MMMMMIPEVEDEELIKFKSQCFQFNFQSVIVGRSVGRLVGYWLSKFIYFLFRLIYLNE
jgi:hypothetical protein